MYFIDSRLEIHNDNNIYDNNDFQFSVVTIIWSNIDNLMMQMTLSTQKVSTNTTTFQTLQPEDFTTIYRR